MTDETKKLFDAPWQCECFELYDKDGHSIAQNIDTEENSCRLSHLPELYDALREAADGKCWSCAGVNVDTVLNKGCPKGDDGDCYVAKWVELLRKVRDGE